MRGRSEVEVLEACDQGVSLHAMKLHLWFVPRQIPMH